jgi:hypothetical protein
MMTLESWLTLKRMWDFIAAKNMIHGKTGQNNRILGKVTTDLMCEN